MREFVSCLLLLFCCTCSIAQLPLKLPDLLSNHAVLQKDTLVKLWGKGPGSFELKIVASWQSEDTVRVHIGPECTWSADIRTPSEKGPYTISFICGKEIKTITDIIMGDVWLCAGQSNMEYNFGWGIDKNDSAYRVGSNDALRFFVVEKNYDNLPVSECKGRWVICDSASAAEFSTVGYFFGKNINMVAKTPVGLIGAYWGGTNIQTWMPSELFTNEQLGNTVRYIEPYGWAPKGVSSLYNAMIYPLTNYRIKGCIWYQGEANVDWDWNRYGNLLQAMVHSWRSQFGTAFYFGAVEIAPWNGYGAVRGAALREQIQLAANSIPSFASISIADLVPDTSNIHPEKKREVGLRLSERILFDVYKYGDANSTPPEITKVTFNGKAALAEYRATGLLRVRGASVSGFQLAGSDGHFYPAKARLTKDNKIEIISGRVSIPTALRYCFENTSVPNLFDGTALPLKQFRTDTYLIH